MTKESDRNPAPVGGDFPCLWGQAFMGGRERERARAREREREERERERERETFGMSRPWRVPVCTRTTVFHVKRNNKK